MPSTGGVAAISGLRQAKTGRGPLLAIAGLVAVSLFVALGLLWHIAGRQDAEATRLSRRLLGVAMEERQRELGRTLGDYAGWGEAYLHLHATVDRDWAFTTGNVGSSLYENLGYELVAVVDPQDRAVYALEEGSLVETALADRMGGGLPALLQAARAAGAETVPVTGLVMLDGQPAMAGAAAIGNGGDPNVALLPGPPSVLVFVDRLDPQTLNGIGQSHTVEGVRLAGTPSAGPVLHLADAGGAGGIDLTWTPADPGRLMLAAVLPWLGFLAAGVAALTLLMLRHAWAAARLVERGARALEASEARLRDIVEASSDWVWETDAELRLTYLSDRFASVTGHRPHRLLGTHLHRFLRPHDMDEAAWRAGWADPAARRSCRDLLCRYVDHAGAERYCRLAAKALSGPDGGFSGYRGTAADVTAEVEAQAELRRLSSHDVLTGLPNRAALHEGLSRRLADASAGGTAVLWLDLDRFKAVNDTLGHHAGDALLREAARRFRACLRRGDLVARLGGDEFVVLQALQGLPGETDALCGRLMECLAAPVLIEGREACVGLSIGVATAPADGHDADTLLRHADIALYEAKADGRGALRCFAPQMSDRLQRRRALELDLRRALGQDELALHFQPRFETAELRLTGVEALLRWHAPGGRIVGPEQFVPLAEETGLIVPIGDWVLREACRQAAPLPGLTVSVNLSPVQFRHGDLVASVEAALATSGLDPRRLELELTEGVLLDSTDAAARILDRLKGLGIRLALDDFGTGYSSLGYLQSFPFDRVKIDRRFVAKLGRSAEALAIVRAVVDLARGLGMATTAEGVETREQLALLRQAGCDEVQGFLTGRPAPLAELALLPEPAGVVRLVAGGGRRRGPGHGQTAEASLTPQGAVPMSGA